MHEVGSLLPLYDRTFTRTLLRVPFPSIVTETFQSYATVGTLEAVVKVYLHRWRTHTGNINHTWLWYSDIMQLNIQDNTFIYTIEVEPSWRIFKIGAGLLESAVCKPIRRQIRQLRIIINETAFLIASTQLYPWTAPDKPVAIIISSDALDIILKRCRKWRVLGYRTRPRRFAVQIRVGFSTGEFLGRAGCWGTGSTLNPSAWYSSVLWTRRRWARQISYRRIHLGMEINN